MDENKLKRMEEDSYKRMEEYASKYKDIGMLWESYKNLKVQERWSKDFLDGYLATISDLIFIKKMN